jgi:hypothetical protein
MYGIKNGLPLITLGGQTFQQSPQITPLPIVKEKSNHKRTGQRSAQTAIRPGESKDTEEKQTAWTKDSSSRTTPSTTSSTPIEDKQQHNTTEELERV